MSRSNLQSSQLARRSFIFGSVSIALASAAAAAPQIAHAETQGSRIDVTQFGTDNVAIQLAIDSALPGDTIWFRTGDYQIAAALKVTKPLTLQGDPGARLVAVAAVVIAAVISVTATNHVTIRGLTIDGNSNPNARQGILAAGCQNILIERVNIQNLVKGTGFGPHGVFFNGNVTDSVITGNTMQTIGVTSAWGAGIQVSNASHRNTITYNTITHTGRGGILTNGASNNLDVNHNQISDTGITAQGLGIELFGSQSSLIEHNFVDHWISLSPSSLTAVRNNIIQGPSETPKFTGLEIVKSTDVVMTNNQVLGGQKVGLTVANSFLKDRIYIAHNRILNCQSDGMLLQGNTNGLAHLYLYDNFVTATTADFDFPWYGYEGTGISMHGNQRAITFESNTVLSNALDAIRFLQPGDTDYFVGGINQLEFIDNSFIGNKGAAVGGPVDATDLIWERNTVAGNQGGDNTLQSVGYVDAPAPGLSLTLPPFAHVGEQITPFLSGPDAAGTQYLWDFASGLPQTGRNVAFTYAAPGLHEVTVIAWTEAGRSQRLSRTITIQP